jgi:hypothetical protein
MIVKKKLELEALEMLLMLMMQVLSSHWTKQTLTRALQLELSL